MTTNSLGIGSLYAGSTEPLSFFKDKQKLWKCEMCPHIICRTYIAELGDLT